VTAIRRDRTESAFSAWLRSEPRLDSRSARLSVQDVDFWIHKYRASRDTRGSRSVDHMMLLEVKTHGRRVDFAQRETLGLARRLLDSKFVFNDNERVRTTKLTMNNEVREVKFYGYFALELSEGCPLTSETIRWHGRVIDLEVLIEVLDFARHPRTLRPLQDRRHQPPGAKQLHPDLFVGAEMR